MNLPIPHSPHIYELRLYVSTKEDATPFPACFANETRTPSRKDIAISNFFLKFHVILRKMREGEKLLALLYL